MSSYVYPSTLPGLTYDNVRTPIFRTSVQQALSGKESRVSLQQYPLFMFQLIYSWLDDSVATSHLKSLMGLFMAMQGTYDTFLYTDPTFNSVTNMNFGTGDNSTTNFQTTATYKNTGGPGIAEIIQNFNSTPQIYLGGVLQTGGGVQYTLLPGGIVQFVNPPGTNVSISWTGSFYYRCRFNEDTLDFVQFMNQWWETKKVVLRTVKL